MFGFDVRTASYLFMALAFSITSRGGVFNIGVEGSFIISSIAACVTGILCDSISPFLLVPLCILSGIAASCIFNAMIYVLKTWCKINEIFSMIIFNYIALHLSNFIVKLDMIKSESGSDTTRRICENAMIKGPNRPIISFVVAAILCVLVYLFFRYTPTGHNIENIRSNKKVALVSGININLTLFYTYMLSAIVAGYAGSFYVIAISRRISVLSTFEGYGFTGILIALFSNSSPLLIIFGSLIFGAIKYVGRGLNLINIPTQVIDLIMCIIILVAVIIIDKREGKKNVC